MLALENFPAEDIAITGFYGQNLPYPGFGKESGFIFSTAVIAALSTLLYLTFKHKDWL